MAAMMDAFLDGTLQEATRRSLTDHLGACPQCQALLTAARESAATLRSSAAPRGMTDAASEPTTEPDLVAGVMARTSGAACPRAESLLPDRSDGVLPAVDGDLLAVHLEHCPPCRALAATLDWLTPLLPELAELEPDPTTAAALLAGTRPLVRRRARWRRLVRYTEEARDGWRRRWRNWWQRPRFALEAAYVAMLLMVALMGTPVSPLKDVPGRALSVVRAGSAGLGLPSDFSATLPGQMFTWGAGVAGQVGDGVSGTVDAVLSDIATRRQAADPAWDRLTEHAATAAGQGRSGRWPEALREIDAARLALGEAWSRWWRPERGDDDSEHEVDNEGGGTSEPSGPGSAGRF
jgi:predicted anti-sigma-YlaC factor YlaD